MTLPFNMPSMDVLFASEKKVYAHYFYPFPLSIGNQPSATDYYNEQYLSIEGENNSHKAYGGYLRARPLAVPVGPASTFQLVNMELEVKMAMARGITGFCFDILSFLDATTSSGHLQMMLAAAAIVDPRFEIVPMLDMSSMVGLTQVQAVQLIASLTHPSIARVSDGRILVAVYNATQPILFWSQIIDMLNQRDIDIALLPVLLGNPSAVGPLAPISIGIGGWGTATSAAAAAPANFMNPILTQQFRPKSQVFWESSGADTFVNGWMSAINDDVPYVQLITWSDFSESGQVQPYTDATLATNIGTAFYDLTAYYATWFLTGEQPQITKDVLYWFHRRMASTVAHVNQADKFTPVGPPEQNNIQLLAFLTKPGILKINGISSLTLPIGIQSFKVPASPGFPNFRLQRNGSDVFEFNSPVQIYGPAGSPAGTLDMTYWGGSHP